MNNIQIIDKTKYKYGFLTYVIDYENNEKYFNIFNKFIVNYEKYISKPLMVLCNEENYEKLKNSIKNKKILIEKIPKENIIYQIRYTNNKENKWANCSRVFSYDFSPFEKTFLIDCDYFIFSNFLEKILLTSNFFKASFYNYFNDKIKYEYGPKESYMCDYGFHSFYGTLMFWEKNEFSKNIWDNIKYIFYEWKNNIDKKNKNFFLYNEDIIRFDKILSSSIYIVYRKENINLEIFKLPFNIYHYYYPFKLKSVDENRAIISNNNKDIIIYKDFHLINKE